MASSRLRTIRTIRTARYAVLGSASADVTELWYVLHGYGQLAATFIRSFDAISSPDRLIVAPEALSRFYVDREQRRVGASWMTRESRLPEIRDYISYLDAVQADIARMLGDLTYHITILGFSQGTATASRWVAAGGVPANRLVLWGGDLPPEDTLTSEDSPLRSMQVAVVAGSDDTWFGPDRVSALSERLGNAGVSFSVDVFQGGHRLDPGMLQTLTSRSESK